MPIVQTLKSPALGRSAVGRALTDLRSRAAESNLLGGAEVNLSEPLPVFRLGLDDIWGSGVESLERTKHIGWRYLLERPSSNVAGYADVREMAGGKTKFTSLAENRNAERLVAAAHLAQDLAKTIPGDCEARILDVPSLNISAVWLTTDPPILIPFIDAERFVEPDASVRSDPGLLNRLVHNAEVLKQNLPKPSRSLSSPG